MDDYFPNQSWDLAAHQVITALSEEIETRGAYNSTLFSGLTGICFAIHLASKGGTRYQKLLSNLHSTLFETLESDYLIPICERGRSPAPGVLFDTITGITGVLAYLLHHLAQERAAILATEMVRSLIDITQLIQWKNLSVPGWISKGDDLVRPEQREMYQNGCFDTGMAHGLAGYLSILAKAYQSGIQLEGQQEAIKKMADWFFSLQQDVGMVRQVWPSRFGFDPEKKERVVILSAFYRDGWCYGSPGIACALFKAGTVLQSRSMKARALNIMEDAFLRVNKEPLKCASFCHGLSGLLCMTHQMSLSTNSCLLRAAVSKLKMEILAHYNEDFPFGFRCLAADPDSDNECSIDNAGLLDGVVGILLSLLFTMRKEPRLWTSLFMIN
jgi:hypothetical protein